MKIVLLGHQKWACITLEELVKSHDVVGVITETDEFELKNKDYYEQRKKFDLYENLKEKAEILGISVYQLDNINQTSLLEELNPDLVVSVSYHSIIKLPLLEKFTFINAHGAPLPKYRGRAPISWAIINGEKKTAVTVHYMANKIDQGNIITQEFFPININDTSMDVLRNSLPLYPKLVKDAIDKILNGYSGMPQDEEQSSYFSSLTEQDLRINWRDPALAIHNLVRGSFPTHRAYTYYEGEKTSIVKTTIINDENILALPSSIYRRGKEDSFIVKTGQGSLEISTDKRLKLGGRFYGCCNYGCR